ncbi:MAG TPA: response regulator transcription factor [Opitutaceae bacterium]|jgi:two-component system response regulator DevR|nr:response regulator transcription factor [Opitutaceae bacterium]
MTPRKRTPIRVLIVDDSELVRAGLRALLGVEPAIAVAGEAEDVATAIAMCKRLEPDVVLLDIRLPDGTGFEACREILRRRPATHVLILTSAIDDHMVDEALKAGAHGYLLKEVNGRSLIHAIIDVADGKSVLDPAVTARVMQLAKAGPERDVLAALSVQENRVLALIAEGKTNKEVGQAMSLSEKTVKNYLSNIFEKLHLTRRTQAAALYAQLQPRS